MAERRHLRMMALLTSTPATRTGPRSSTQLPNSLEIIDAGHFVWE
jgi:hypothetical protein